MIPVSFVYDENFDRPKLTEQKNHLSVLSLPQQVARNNKLRNVSKIDKLNKVLLK